MRKDERTPSRWGGSLGWLLAGLLLLAQSSCERAPAPQEVLTVGTTAYTHQEEAQKKWGLITASGAPLQASRKHNTAAADWSRFPVGTVFRIQGRPERYVVEDYGSALVGENVMDLYRAELDQVNEWGRREVSIEVLEWGSLERSREILKPRVKVPYCKTMYDAIEARLGQSGGD